MKREYFENKSAIEIQRYLRRINAMLLRLIPKTVQGAGWKEAYVVLYIEK